MSLDPQLLRQLHETFRAELDDQLGVITDGLLALEGSENASSEREELLNSVFRAAHNLKGAARSVDLRDISDIAHHLESLFSASREQGATPGGDIVDLSLETLDKMRHAMDAHQQEQPLPFELSDLLGKLDAETARLERHARPGPTDNDGNSAALAGDGVIATRARPRNRPDDASEARAPVFATPPGLSTPSTGCGKALSAAGTEHIRVTTDKLARVAALAEELQVAKIGLDDRLAKAQRLDLKLRQLASMWRRARPQLQGRIGVELPVDIQQLLDSTGEQVADVEEGATQLGKAMRSSANRIGVLSTALQSDIRLLRLVPVATLLQPMMRTVREIGREQGKLIELRIAGDHVEMDRMVLDGIRDPLLHLLRNAIDHGLEAPDERRQVGKPDTGVLSLDVRSEGGHVVIKVSDDGRGIAPASIRRAAERRRIVSANELERMSDADLLDLLFRPGFSTRQVVTDLSGRGIGLDVVRSNVDALKGSVELGSELGAGTSFVLRLPITLSTERGLQVRVAGESLVIPSVAVERILDVPADGIGHAQGEAVVVLDGNAVVLRDLAQLLSFESYAPRDRSRISVVVVSRSSAKVALIVDEVDGEREIVVKRLLPPLETVHNVTGATLTGDGSVMVVLDPVRLIETALRGASVTAPAVFAAEDRVRTRILVVDDSITTRTLERNILEGHGYDVTVASDGQEAWDTVQRGRFDLVVTDIEMPRMSGLELTERIKANKALADLPVIIVSSLAQDDEVRLGMEVGADAYLTKGVFETRVLIDAVARLV